jgi:hypothetical protein
MNRKGIVILIFILVLLLGIIGFNYVNNKPATIITLDINPSIEIHLNNKEEIINIKALNSDAEKVISNDLKGRKFNDAITHITDNIIQNNFIEDNHVVILFHAEGKDNVDYEEKVKNSFEGKNIATELIVVEEISNEDKELASKYNISPAKAAYINSIKEKNENVKVEELPNKPIDELRDTKDRGLYCEEGYTLEGDFCIREKSREAASTGEVCPRDYYEYEGVCYKETGLIETSNYKCREDFTLEDNKCYLTEIIDALPAKYSCSKGETKTRLEMGLTTAEAGDANDIVCVDLSKATHPVSPCELPASDPTERMKSGGKCYWHRAPVISSGCPGKIKVNGECWDDASSILICAGYRDGKQYKSRDEYCEHSIKYINPTVTEYKCEGDFVLKDNKCVREFIEDPYKEMGCPNNYSLVDNDRCINLKETTNKENGYYCNSNEERLKGNMCITYERIDAIR